MQNSRNNNLVLYDSRTTLFDTNTESGTQNVESLNDIKAGIGRNASAQALLDIKDLEKF